MIAYTLQVVSAAKYVMKKESTIDHVDLLLSSKHWPVVFAVDMVCDVAAHVEVRHPKLATALWGERRACFQKPHPRNDPQVSIHMHMDDSGKQSYVNQALFSLGHSAS